MPKLKPASQPASRPINWTLWIAIALAVATLSVYVQVTHFEFVSIDDQDYSTSNPHLTAGLTRANIAWAFTSSYDANWFPLTWISLMLDRQFFGWDPGPRHAINLGLHILSTLLLFLLLNRVTRSIWPSAFVAFAFALHPLHVESVAWIAERKDVLCALFFFATIWVYVNYVERPALWRYWLVVATFACALMSKPMAVTLPFVLLLLDAWPLARFTRKAIFEKIPLVAMAIASSIITFLVQRAGGAVLGGNLVPLSIRLANALVSYSVYLLKFFWPSNLAVFYPYAEIFPWQVVVGTLALAAITALVIIQRRDRPYLAVGWFWYLGMLTPVIGFIQVGLQARADRYMYLPMVGIAIMLAWGTADLLARRPALKPALAAMVAVICGAWGFLTWTDLEYWRSSGALYQRAIDSTEDNYVAENGIAGVLLSQGRADEAGQHLRRVIAREPWFAGGHVNLGASFSKMGKPREAAEQYREALRLEPESAEAHCGLGVALGELGRPQEAIPQFYEALRIRPDYSDAHYDLGRIFGLQGRTVEAVTQFSEAIRLQPADREAHFNLGIALAALNRMQEGADQFRIAIELKPDYVNARFNYASMLANQGRYDEAIAQLNEVLRIAPDFPQARESLAQCIELRNESKK